MPLDTRMLLTAGPGYVPPLDPALAMGRGVQLGRLITQGQQDQLDLAEAQRQALERGTLAQAFRGALTTDPTTGQTTVDVPRALTAAYRTTSDPLAVFKAQQEYGKSQAASRKDTLEAQKLQLEQQRQGLEFGGQVAQGVEDRIAAGADPQAAWQWGLATMRQAGFPIQGITPTYDASMLAGWKGQALALKDRLTSQQKQVEQQLQEREVRVKESEIPLNRAKTQREEREARGAAAVEALEPGATPRPLPEPRTMSEADIADAMRQTGRSRAEVVTRAHELGWRTPDRTAPAGAGTPPAPVSPPDPRPGQASGAGARAPAAAEAPVPAGVAPAPAAPGAAPAPAAETAPAAAAPTPAAPAPAASPASPRLQADAQRLRTLERMRDDQEEHVRLLHQRAGTTEAGKTRIAQAEQELTRRNQEIARLQERLYEQGPESLERRKAIAQAGVDVKLDEPLSTEDASRLGVGLGTTWRDIREGTTAPSRGPVPPLKGEAAKTYQLGGRMALGHGTVAQLEDRGVTGRPFLLHLEGAMDKLGSGAVATVLGVATRGSGLGAVGSTAGGGALGLGIGNLATGLVNQARTPAERMYVTGQLAFIAGILRKESGAAISAQEYLQYARIYFPQPGDDAETIAYKRQLRQAEIDALQEEYPNRPFPAAPALPEAVTRERPAGVPPGFTRETPALRGLNP